jgi:hypothetical protein
MHLFGDSSGPHLTHFQARREGNRVELGWDIRNAPALRWRVLRSEQDFATSSDALPGSGQTVVMEGTETYVMDDQVVERTPYFYTVFAGDEQGVWHQQVKTKLAHRDRRRWLHPSYDEWSAGGAFANEGDYQEGGVIHGSVDKTLALGTEPPPMH